MLKSIFHRRKKQNKLTGSVPFGKTYLKAIILTVCLSQAFLFSKEEFTVSQKDCGLSPSPIRMGARYTIGRGVGYSQGYSTLEGFFAATPWFDDAWIPYLDMRGHVFDNGKFAANAGLGLRYMNSRVWGINAYYDYRNTVHQHYNQVSLGLESLGLIWDFRINGYLPVGAKKSPFYDAKFASFQGNQMYISVKQEFAMKGANAEVGAHITNAKNAQLYAAVGPYYFQNAGKHSWGGEGRLVFETLQHIRLQLNGSYDSLFKGIIQGEVGVFYAFGPRKVVRKTQVEQETGFFSSMHSKKEAKTKEDDACRDAMLLRERALQRIDRNEIIVLDKKRERGLAKDLNGQPYSFVFVDNTSHSNGTFESPYNSLTAAENNSKPGDILYIFPGDGTATGMESGITLQDSQRLLGASIPHQFHTIFGTITLPPLASTAPVINNMMVSSGLSTINLSSNNEVSGFTINDVQGVFNSASISFPSGTNALITHNTITTIGSADAINIGDPLGVSIPHGDVTVANNRILGGDINPTFGAVVYGGDMNIMIRDNIFSGIDSSSGLTEGVSVSPQVSGPIVLSIVDNIFNSLEASNSGLVAPIYITTSVDSPLNVSIIGNLVETPNVPSMAPLPLGGVYVLQQISGVGTISLDVIDDNAANTPAGVTGFVFSNTTGDPSLLIVNFSSNNEGTRVGPP